MTNTDTSTVVRAPRSKWGNSSGNFSKTSLLAMAATLALWVLLGCTKSDVGQATQGQSASRGLVGMSVPELREWRLDKGTSLQERLLVVDTIIVLIADPAACSDCHPVVSRLLATRRQNPKANLLLFSRNPSKGEMKTLRRLGIKADALLVSGPEIPAQELRLFRLTRAGATELPPAPSW